MNKRTTFTIDELHEIAAIPYYRWFQSAINPEWEATWINHTMLYRKGEQLVLLEISAFNNDAADFRRLLRHEGLGV